VRDHYTYRYNNWNATQVLTSGIDRHQGSFGWSSVEVRIPDNMGLCVHRRRIQQEKGVACEEWARVLVASGIMDDMRRKE
jgi:hypothetical protein